MNEIPRKNTGVQTFSHILILVGLFFIGLFLSSILALFPLSIIYGFSLDQEGLTFLEFNRLQNHPDGQGILLFVQAVTSVITFLISVYLFLVFFEKKNFSVVNSNTKIPLQALGLTILVSLAIMPITSFLLELNQKMVFPSMFSDFESWATNMENQLGELTLFLTKFDNWGAFLIGLLVIAVIPALGEELFFRGMLQRTLSQSLSTHVAIWVSAFIFSAIHQQFYGFLPRAVLGAVFGYLYVWSGNIWLPILAHFVNNGFTLLMIHLYNQNFSDTDVGPGTSAPWYLVLLGFFVSVGLLYRLRQLFIPIRQVRSEAVPEVQ